ncbi:MAG TPA: hypothetical protein DCE77_11525 [Methylophaga sp.]|uniref:ERF family protein n=1 Tax=unclassified Methylophaga TaxID=2629249 RepID=UPI000C8E6EAC|nr:MULTISPECIES: ERF family protein [unclassified Methylophaga]MAP27750.1 hypothetical protein [Methylophaga sp.]HAD32196.1 hypothetical protein [Methylophaga sp.]HBX59857.1 hypothetical protein [Methylophaga sp.]|tara:strand:+ start:678 stop:1274 length:597 start_codon:yes stop_codon:yes gene_type:complete
MSMSKIQAELKAPKGQFNSFGKYKYRSCEDIVEAVKPILAKHEYYLSMSDDVVGVGDRVYIKATCRVMQGDKVIAESTALAREAETKKGMDDSQITGTASSYARKYALNGLFAIDDTKDADTDEHKTHVDTAPKPAVVTADQAKELKDRIHETSTDTARFLQHFSGKEGYTINSVDELPQRAFKAAIAMLNKKVKEAA